MTASIKIIQATEEHHRYVIDSFLREFSKAPYARGANWRQLAAKMRALLNAPSWQCDVAVSPSEPDEAMGYLVRSGEKRAAWLQVKAAYRRIGVATALFENAGLDRELLCAFLSPRGCDIAARKGVTLRHRPYLVDAAEEETATLLLTTSDNGE